MLKQPPSKPVLNSTSEPSAPPTQTSVKQTAIKQEQTAIKQKQTALQKETAAGREVDAVELETSTEIPPQRSAASPKAMAKRIAARIGKTPTVGKVAIALGVLGGATGLAFTQIASPELQAAVLPDRPTPPVSTSNVPEVQPFTSTQDLFLTNQIFYRKVEALAGVALTGEATPEAETAGKAKNAAAKGGKTNDKGKRAETKANKAKADAEKAAQAEKVTAAAPPAPAPEEVVFTGTTIDSVLEMRVAVAKDVSAIGFATSSAGSITDLDGNVLKSLSAETGSLAAIAGGLTVDGEPIPGGAFWIYPENGGYVAIGDSWYRGRVLVALRDRGLIAVNYVLLGDYLYSVVGSEMSPDWSIESLKAQAVAARSYALTHNIRPASEAYFDLDNTQRFQAYKGIAREASTTIAAVQTTAGEFISHEGGIVESLYAASQDIVDDAHKGSGMSQLGAKDLAEQGYSYAEILAHYYPTTALGRIETDAE